MIERFLLFLFNKTCFERFVSSTIFFIYLRLYKLFGVN